MDPQYSPQAAFDDVASIVKDPPESVNFERAEKGLDFIATWMSDEDVNVIAKFIDSMMHQDEIEKKAYDSVISILKNMNKEFGMTKDLKDNS